MTTNPTDDMNTDDLDALAAAASDRLAQTRALIAAITQARDSQPDRLVKARAEAEQARDWAFIEEPWKDQCTAIVSVDGSASLTLPNWIGKEVFGARLAFDILDCGDDIDRQNDVVKRYFSMVNGDTGTAMLLMWAALTTIATAVVPMMLDEIEDHASNYDARVFLAEARTKAWSERVGVLRAEAAANCPDDGDDPGEVTES